MFLQNIRWVYLDKDFRRDHEHHITPQVFKEILILIQIQCEQVLDR